jgi:hypothetical protein
MHEPAYFEEVDEHELDDPKFPEYKKAALFVCGRELNAEFRKNSFSSLASVSS